MWLKQEMGRRCYFPDSSGHFNIDAEGLGVSGFTFGLIVEGTPLPTNRQPESSPSTTVASVPSTSAGAGPSQPYYKPTIASKKTGADGNFNVKIVKAKVTKLPNGKVDFVRMEQMHVNVDEPSANVNTITSAIQSRWGANYVVVTADGLEVDDSAGTRGMYYMVVCVVQ